MEKENKGVSVRRRSLLLGAAALPLTPALPATGTLPISAVETGPATLSPLERLQQLNDRISESLKWLSRFVKDQALEACSELPPEGMKELTDLLMKMSYVPTPYTKERQEKDPIDPADVPNIWKRAFLDALYICELSVRIEAFSKTYPKIWFNDFFAMLESPEHRTKLAALIDQNDPAEKTIRSQNGGLSRGEFCTSGAGSQWLVEYPELRVSYMPDFIKNMQGLVAKQFADLPLINHTTPLKPHEHLSITLGVDPSPEICARLEEVEGKLFGDLPADIRTSLENLGLKPTVNPIRPTHEIDLANAKISAPTFKETATPSDVMRAGLGLLNHVRPAHTASDIGLTLAHPSATDPASPHKIEEVPSLRLNARELEAPLHLPLCPAPQIICDGHQLHTRRADITLTLPPAISGLTK